MEHPDRIVLVASKGSTLEKVVGPSHNEQSIQNLGDRRKDLSGKRNLGEVCQSLLQCSCYQQTIQERKYHYNPLGLPCFFPLLVTASQGNNYLGIKYYGLIPPVLYFM